MSLIIPGALTPRQPLNASDLIPDSRTPSPRRTQALKITGFILFGLGAATAITGGILTYNAGERFRAADRQLEKGHYDFNLSQALEICKGNGSEFCAPLNQIGLQRKVGEGMLYAGPAITAAGVFFLLSGAIL